MSPFRRDYFILDKFNFERKPVGVKFLLEKPEGIKQTDKRLGLCEMFVEGHVGSPFYAGKENMQCGGFVVGMQQFPPVFHSGQIGPKFSMFKDPSANRRVYGYIPTLLKDSVEYIAFSPYDKLTFDPDLLIFTANTTQAEVLLRASSYSNGNVWSFKGATCLTCVWLFSYPYLTGEVNLSVTGLGYGLKARHALPEGLLLISVPFNTIPTLLDNLEEMEWDPHWFHLGRDGYVKGIEELAADMARKFPGAMNFE
jgi:uncharacterized protein (DUF169 family)